MRAVNHGLTGAAIAVVVKQPLLAMPLAYLSHFVCDAIPHSGTGDLPIRSAKFIRILVVDCTLAVACILTIASIWHQQWWLVIICAFLAASPDLAWLYYRYFHPKKPLDPISRFHTKIQWSETTPGYIVEAVWFAVLFGSLIYFGLQK